MRHAGFRNFDKNFIISHSLIHIFFSIHICCTLLHTKEGVADKFIADVKANMREIVADPNAHTGGMVSRVEFGTEMFTRMQYTVK